MDTSKTLVQIVASLEDARRLLDATKVLLFAQQRDAGRRYLGLPAMVETAGDSFSVAVCRIEVLEGIVAGLEQLATVQEYREAKAFAESWSAEATRFASELAMLSTTAVTEPNAEGAIVAAVEQRDAGAVKYEQCRARMAEIERNFRWLLVDEGVLPAE